MCLWFRKRSLGHFLLLHSVNFEAMVISSLWADIISQAVNSARNSSATGRGAGFCSLCTGLYFLGSLSLIGLWWVIHSAIGVSLDLYLFSF